MATDLRPGEQVSPEGERGWYRLRMREAQQSFTSRDLSGPQLVEDRSKATDLLLRELWHEVTAADTRLREGAALLATGGYGRQELFPFSDVDLLFLLGPELQDRDVKEAVRLLSQRMWDAGVRFAPTVRKLSECERVDPDNIEFGLSLLDVRPISGTETIARKLIEKALPKAISTGGKHLVKGLLELTRERHAKYGDTLFHLEPNIKECPGGLRDAHVCRWLTKLTGDTNGLQQGAAVLGGEFHEALDFLTDLRCFLHLRHERDDNTLDWQAQDKAAELLIGLAHEGRNASGKALDAAYWMRIYFRNARAIDRGVKLNLSKAGESISGKNGFARLLAPRKTISLPGGYSLKDGSVSLEESAAGKHARADPDLVLALFAEIARTGVMPDASVETDLVAGLPSLASRVEDGPGLWHRLREILLCRYAGAALRGMHAVGLLDLLIPEFHGIDSLVIRDAYHRYTVDEHTFVLIDTLHSLPEVSPRQDAGWAMRFYQVLCELPHPELLYLAALMHDTGKGRSTGDHTVESARLTGSVLARLELEPYEASQVIDLVRNHLEMSSALRRDIFDAETIRSFASKVQTQEALRMLLLFTYADLNAVHPDALTPWKAENLWRLYITTSNYLDHSVDEERVGARATELVARIAATMPERTEAIARYVEGFPERYVRTRTVEQIRRHFEMAGNFGLDSVQIDFRYAAGLSELVLVTMDRPALFANVAGALASWGMNIVTADAFSNRQGVVVDSFRFTDTFRTLELNESEIARFISNVHDVVSGRISVEKMLSGRRRSSRRTLKPASAPQVLLHDDASSHSSLLEVITQDTPGLLRTLSLTFAAHGCNIEVALVDTEGETAIDVFYLTQANQKLSAAMQTELARALKEAIKQNAMQFLSKTPALSFDEDSAK